MMTHLRTVPSLRPFLFIIGLLFLIAAFSSCHRDALFGIKGTGPSLNETRNPGAFTGVDMNVDASVILHTDTFYRVEITAQANILEVLRTVINGNTLKVYFTDEVRTHKDITIHIYAPTYQKLELAGSGSVSCSDSIHVTDFYTSVSGSGSLSFTALDAVTVKSIVSGSGDVTLAGTGQSLVADISGSGSVKTFGLAVLTGDVSISGSGKMEINATQQITGSISGSGSIYYKNNPTINVSVSGSGRIVHVQ